MLMPSRSPSISTARIDRVFAIGASAGGLEALREFLPLLPGDFPSPVLVVVHTTEDSPGLIPKVLQRATQMRVLSPFDSETLYPAHVYVAPPNYHMQVERGRARLFDGPNENRLRPAIDPLFSSTALAYGPNAVGIILSGYLDDGSAGLLRIKQAGGVTIVQDLDDAIVPDMPRNARDHVQPDYSVPIRELAPLMVRLAKEPVPPPMLPVQRQQRQLSSTTV